MQLPDMESKVYSRLSEDEDGCWLWPPVSLKHRRGVVNVDGRTIEAIKLIWMDMKGDLPERLVVHATCGKILCCNPEHVEWITRSILNSRSLSNTKVCKKAGHPRTPEDTYVTPTGKRTCRICREEGKRLFRAQMYGLTVEELDSMESSSGGVCAICGKPPSPGIGLNVDHDHTTGAVRKLLCPPCNKGLGFFRDDPDLLRAAIGYLESSTSAVA